MNKALIKTVKEGLRIALFAGLSALVAWASTELTSLDPSSMIVVVGTVVLRLADKFIHENGDIKANGIAPF